MKQPTPDTERRLDAIRETARVGQALLPVQPALSYHDLPLLKPPVWTWEIPAYFFVGGAAGASAFLACAAQLTDTNPRLVRDARRIAAVGAALSAPLLISDLGRPARFLYMLRVFKIQSPMSVGAWTVAVFGGAATGAVVLPKLFADASALIAAGTGLVMATYTGVLLGATAIPLWADNARVLPVHFGASSLGSAVALLELHGHDDTALNALGLGAALFETASGMASPATTSSRIFALADALAGPIPLALRVLGARSKRARKVAAVSSLLGSLITRFAWVESGKASARRVS